MDIDGLYKLLKQSQNFNKEKFADIVDIINAQNSRSRAKSEELHDLMMLKFNKLQAEQSTVNEKIITIETDNKHIIKQINEIKARQDITNGKVISNENTIKPIRWMAKHYMITIAILLILFFALEYLADNSTIIEIWQFIKKIL